MPTELKRADITMAVNGDALDIFFPMKTDRVLLDRLVVRLDRQGKKIKLCIGRPLIVGEPGEGGSEALYAWGDTWKVNGHIWLIDPQEEPAYREFFTQVAAECGRTVSNAEQEKPRSRWRR